MNLIAERLKTFRNEQAHNQEGVAKVAGMTQRAWSGWEENPPKALQSLVDIATHYSVSVDYLLNLTDDSTPRRAKLSAVMQELLQVARRLSASRLNDLLLIAKVFAEEDRRGGAGAAEGQPPSGPSQDPDGEAARQRAQTGIDAAMNVVTRKYGEDVERELRKALADNFPELADLLDPPVGGAPEHKRINKG